ncbi:hypothetical protein HPB50_011899 [Hyalomma asiaticum]|uniref:Uncharacterized protein n=1 Tax=Hyalomma asiaticum TaxID=266040 RepID=A0ACB7SEC9_HYAAI|nr:hypothetical protein HPB50_011899 [Hyalomma asiaticum]
MVLLPTVLARTWPKPCASSATKRDISHPSAHLELLPHRLQRILRQLYIRSTLSETLDGSLVQCALVNATIAGIGQVGAFPDSALSDTCFSSPGQLFTPLVAGGTTVAPAVEAAALDNNAVPLILGEDWFSASHAQLVLQPPMPTEIRHSTTGTTMYLDTTAQEAFSECRSQAQMNPHAVPSLRPHRQRRPPERLKDYSLSQNPPSSAPFPDQRDLVQQGGAGFSATFTEKMLVCVQYEVDSATEVIDHTDLEGFQARNVADFDDSQLYDVWCRGNESTDGGYYKAKLSAHPRHIVSASCTCKAGCRGWCKHAAAVAVYLNKCEHTSRTDLPCAWLGPSSRLILDARKTIKDLFPGRPLPAPQLKPLCATAVLAKFPDLQCPLRQVLEDPGNSVAMRADAAENVARHIDHGLMREVIDHERNVYHVMEVVHTLPLRIGMRNMLATVTRPERAFYERAVQKTIDQIMDIEQETRGQSKLPSSTEQLSERDDVLQSALEDLDAFESFEKTVADDASIKLKLIKYLHTEFNPNCSGTPAFICQPGARTEDLHNLLQFVPATATTLILPVGTNGLASTKGSVVFARYPSLLQAVFKECPSVRRIFTTLILPHTTNRRRGNNNRAFVPKVNTEASFFNQRLRQFCRR